MNKGNKVKYSYSQNRQQSVSLPIEHLQHTQSMSQTHDQRNLSLVDGLGCDDSALDDYQNMSNDAQISVVQQGIQQLKVSDNNNSDEQNSELQADNDDISIDDEEKDENKSVADDPMDIVGAQYEHKNNSDIKPQIYKRLEIYDSKSSDDDKEDYDADIFANKVMQSETGGADPDSFSVWLQEKFLLYTDIKNKKTLGLLTPADQSNYMEYLQIVWFSANRVTAMR